MPYRMLACLAAVACAAAIHPAAASRASHDQRPPAGVVSTAHPLATAAGIEMLEAGGNAFDAAVAIAAALNVVEPAMSGLGGYGTVMIHHAASGRTRFLNTSGRIPAGVNSDAYRAPTPGHLANRTGAKAVSTPVNLRGWEALSREYGTREWRTLFARAIALAADGYELSAPDAAMIAGSFQAFPAHARAIYGRDGQPLAAGARLVQADLARTLTTIAERGASDFYTGDTGARIAGEMRAAGGFLSARDLAAAAAEWYEPIRIRYRGIDVVTASPPANTFDFLVRLGIVSTKDMRALGHNSAGYLHTFAEATKHGFWVRLRYAGDPEVAAPPLNLLLSEEYWREQAAQIDPAKAKPFQPPLAKTGNETTHFVVADAEGNVVSATQTLGNAFGSRIMAPGTGVWLNNSLAYSTFEPKGNPMDAHAGRHKLSGDCPTILMRDGRPWIALGTPGGHTIGQTVPQIIMNILDFGMDLPAALTAPRIAFAEPDVLLVERTVPEDVRAALSARGHKVTLTRAIGNATALSLEYGADRKPVRFTAAADPRGSGTARIAGAAAARRP